MKYLVCAMPMVLCIEAVSILCLCALVLCFFADVKREVEK